MMLLVPAAAVAGADGLQGYVEDMDRMRAVLSSSPPPFPWETVVLLTLVALAWFAALAAGIYWHRRALRLRASASAKAPDVIDIPAV